MNIKRNNDISVIILTHNEEKHIARCIKSAKKYFNVNIILDNNKDMSAVSKLHNLNDIDRNLISCEGRSYIGKWLHLSPK